MKMTSKTAILKLRTQWHDAQSLPSTPFQQSMLGVIYIVFAFAFLSYCLRMQSKIVQKQLGLGKPFVQPTPLERWIEY